MTGQPCTTLEQRWSACRARMYGEETLGDFAWCQLWKPHLTMLGSMLGVRVHRATRPCSSPRRHGCRTGTERRGRDQDPAKWGCAGWRRYSRDMFLGPLASEPISDAVWYERP